MAKTDGLKDTVQWMNNTIYLKFQFTCSYMEEILPIRRKTLSNQSINKSISSRGQLKTPNCIIIDLLRNYLLLLQDSIFFSSQLEIILQLKRIIMSVGQ